MAGTYTKTITFAGPNNPNGDNYTWIDVSGAVSQGWISYSQRTGTEQWDFTIETWTNPSSASRSADFKAKHWQWTNDSQTSLWDSFTITQYNDNSIEVTTTQATTYTVTYQAVANPSDIVGSHPNAVGGVSAGNYTVSGPTWSVTGMTFIGFAEGDSAQAPANIQPGDVITITGDKTLYAKYEATATTQAATTETPTTVPPTTVPPTTVPPTTVPPTTQVPTYTLTYDANGGSGAGTGPTTGTLPLTVANNPYDKTGYSFTEWNTTPSGDGAGYAEGASYNVAANDTLYAQWSINPTTTQPPTTQATTQLPPAAVFIDGYEDFYESGTAEPFTANISNINNPSYLWTKTGSKFGIMSGQGTDTLSVEYFGFTGCDDPDQGSVSVTVTGTDLAGNSVTVSDSLILSGCDECNDPGQWC